MGKNLLKSVKKKPVRSIVPRGLDVKYMGEEPEDVSTEAKLGHALNWYNYMVDEKQCRGFLVDWMTAQPEHSADALLLDRLPDWRFQGTVGALARVMTRGGVLPSGVRERFLGRVSEIVAAAKRVAEPKPVAQPVASRTDPAHAIIAEVDERIDELCRFERGRAEWSMYDFLKSKSVSGPVAKRVAAHFSRLRDELEQAARGGDEQLKEAYRLFKKRQLTEYLEFVSRVVSDCSVWDGNAKKARAPRKKRAKSADSIVKRIKYLQSHSETKLVSVQPASIVGARVLWTYNVKSRTLARYEWSEGEFELKGSTLSGYSVAGQKKLRKPEAVLPHVVTGGPKAADKTFLDVKSKISAPNGRVNQHTILLRVVK